MNILAAREEFLEQILRRLTGVVIKIHRPDPVEERFHLLARDLELADQEIREMDSVKSSP